MVRFSSSRHIEPYQSIPDSTILDEVIAQREVGLAVSWGVLAYIFSFFLILEGTSPKFLQLQLKRYPETIEEMLIFRYWLKKLSYCFIENFKFEQGFINPDIFELFFGDYPLKFYTKYFYLYNKGGYCFPKGLEFMYHYVVICGCKGLHYEDSDRKMFGEMVKDEERYFKRFSLEEEEKKEFCKVVEYQLFEVDNPLEDAMLYLCFRIGSKKAFYYETVGTFV